MSSIPYIIGDNYITVNLDGKSIPVGKSHVAYDKVIDAVKAANRDTLRDLLMPKNAIMEMANRSSGEGDLTAGSVSMVDGELYYNDEPIHSSLASRIITMFNDGFNIKSMLKYMDNLYQNPSFRAKNELYGFLDACRLPITEDGHFLAYKMVSSKYKDLYTGTMDNSVGATPKMRRNDVDEDSDRTCSYGLHFASLEYVKNGGYARSSRGDRLMVVKVNPRDVVSIPRDYNNSKGRACEYLILEELDWDSTLEIPNFGQGMDTAANVPDETEDWDEEEEFEEEEEGIWDEEEEQEEEEPVSTPKPVTGAKLDDAKVRRFKRLMFKEGVNLTTACNIIGISRRQGGRIRDGENWSHVTDY